jgi:hypothetical protein
MTENTKVIEGLEETVYLVKFNCGYFAAKQPHYDWSFTDDPILAQKYKTIKKAKERGEWGVDDAFITLNPPLKSYVIEKFIVKTVFQFEGVEE